MKNNNVPYEKPPNAYMNRMMKLAEEAMNLKVVPSEALNNLIQQFKDEELPYSILNSNDLGNPTVSAVAFYDKVLAPYSETNSLVFMADVTHGLTEISCGFSKWFFFSIVLPQVRAISFL
jgi:lauroyl/myristoyl acyltransferase